MGTFDVARYRLIRRAGEGATGEVFLAEPSSLTRGRGARVALKIFNGFFSSIPGFADRALAHARCLARLRHPSLVPVLDCGVTPAGRVVSVTEWLDGTPLREELAARGPLPVAEAVSHVRSALAGLHAAHGAGLIHRDVTLSSLFLSRPGDAPGAVRVLDFGVAKAVGHTIGSSRGAPIELDFPFGDGGNSGRCLSPEQVLGHPADARTDIYGAAAVLYALLCGRGPFDHAEGPVARAEAHAFDEPSPPSRWRARRLPGDLEEILLRALAKRPADRVESAAAFDAELARFAAPAAVRTTLFREAFAR
jgi:serine/threonine-protein kinase